MSWLERVRSDPPDSADITFSRLFWVASVVSAGTRVDTNRSQLISTQANVVTEPSTYGMAYRGTSTGSNTKISSGGGAATSGCYVGTTNPIAVGARFKLNSTGTNQAIFSDMNSGGFDSLSISYVTSGGYIKVSVRNTGATGYNAQIALPDPAGWHDALLVHVPGVGLFGYLDGYLFGSQTTAGQGACTERYNSSGDPAWLANGSFASFQNSDATLALGYILRGDYQAEAPSLTRNPWQLYEPEQIWIPAAAGGAYTASISEALALADSASQVASLSASANEALTLSDSASAIAAFAASISEALALADSQDAVVGRASSISESMTLADTRSNVAALSATITEAMTLGDIQNSATAGNYAVAVSESMSLADSGSNVATLIAAISEAMSLASTAAATLPGNFNAAIAEALALSDAATVQAALSATLVEALALSDGASAPWAVYVSMAEAMALADVVNGSTVIAGPAVAGALVGRRPPVTGTRGERIQSENRRARVQTTTWANR